jgi:hypothetical protein
MDAKAMIEAAADSHGLTILGWDQGESGLEAQLGRYLVVSDDCEDDGLYEGDEGDLTACVVGAEEYRNQRVSFTLTTEDVEGGNEVRDLDVVEPVT